MPMEHRLHAPLAASPVDAASDPGRDGGASATADLASLYGEAWERFLSSCLWNVRRVDHPTPRDALHVARALRAKGDLEAYRLSDRLREAAVAA